MVEPEYPGAVPPERVSAVESLGLRLNLFEWGDPTAPPVLLCHGMWDHARSFAPLAPLLAERYRVLALDARGHGDSDWADAYPWPAHIQDIINVVRWLGGPVRLIGHSMGGGQATDAARAVPDLVVKVVNIDGFGPPPFGDDMPPMPVRFAEYLDFRRRFTKRPTWRAYDDLQGLAERRRAHNPRLSKEWLRYFVYHGAKRQGDGWTWKSDPQMAAGVGPWRPEWITLSYATLTVPMLAITGSEEDTWGPLPEKILRQRLSRVRRLERCTIQGAGHFVHIERPQETAAVILDYLRS